MSDFTRNEYWGAIGGKIDPLSDIRNAGIVTSGRVFWVKATTDADYNTVKDQVGGDRMFNSIQLANNAMRSDKNDYVLVTTPDSNTAVTHGLSAGSAVVLNKAKSHVISVGYTKAIYGYTNTITLGGTTVAYDTSIVKVQAPNVEMAGFRILGTAGTSANGTTTTYLSLGTAATGTAHEFWGHDLSVETTVAVTGGANGTPTMVGMTNATGPDGARFDNCLMGNTGAGPCSPIVQLNHIGKHHQFSDCQFVTFVGAAAGTLVACGTGATNYTLFNRCNFINLDSATAVTSAFAGSVTVKNPVLVQNCGFVNITAAGTDPTVYVSPIQSGTAGAGMHNLGVYIVGSAPIPAA